MTEMVYKNKLTWENITKVLVYLILFGIIIGFFYFLVAQPTIDILSKPIPGAFYNVEDCFNI